MSARPSPRARRGLLGVSGILAGSALLAVLASPASTLLLPAADILFGELAVTAPVLLFAPELRP